MCCNPRFLSIDALNFYSTVRSSGYDTERVKVNKRLRLVRGIYKQRNRKHDSQKSEKSETEKQIINNNNNNDNNDNNDNELRERGEMK